MKPIVDDAEKYTNLHSAIEIIFHWLVAVLLVFAATMKVQMSVSPDWFFTNAISVFWQNILISFTELCLASLLVSSIGYTTSEYAIYIKTTLRTDHNLFL